MEVEVEGAKVARTRGQTKTKFGARSCRGCLGGREREARRIIVVWPYQTPRRAISSCPGGTLAILR